MQEKLWILMFGSRSEPRDSHILRPRGSQLNKSPSQLKSVMSRRGNALPWPSWVSFGCGLMTAQRLLQHWHFGHRSSLVCLLLPHSPWPCSLLSFEGPKCSWASAMPCEWDQLEGIKLICLYVQKEQQQENLEKKTLTLNASHVCFILFYFGTIAAVDFINFLQHCWEI